MRHRLLEGLQECRHALGAFAGVNQEVHMVTGTRLVKPLPALST
jgi:hypothetical protein